MSDFNFPFMQLVNEAVSEEREKKEQTAWWPSGFGSCPTGRYLARKGEQSTGFDVRTLRIFSVGSLFETWLLDAFEKRAKEMYPEIVIDRQAWFVDNDLNVRGKADMKIELADFSRLFEVKSMHSNSFHWMKKKGENGKLHHRMQLWIGLRTLNIPRGELVYISKDDLTVYQYQVFLDDKHLEEITLDDINLMNKAWSAGLPPPPLPPEAWQSNYCNFHHLCVAQPEYLPVPAGTRFYEVWKPEPKKVGVKRKTKPKNT